MMHRDDSPLVTIVVPAYNAEPYLRKTLDSVLRQRFPRWELVVVDDGSTDRTAEIARSYADPRIQVMSGPNIGLSGARNRGLAAAKGEFIAFLDADDLWVPDMLERQLTILTSDATIAAVGGRMRYLGPRGRTFGATPIPHMTAEDHRRIATGELPMPFPIGSALFRTHIVRDVGAFDASLHRCEDLDFWARLSMKHRIASNHNIVGYYRVHTGSMTAANYAQYWTHIRFVQARLRSRRRGDTLTWEDFMRDYRPTFKERYSDTVRTFYRRAAVAALYARWPSAAAYGLLVLLADPVHFIRRLLLQVRGSEMRHVVEGT